MLLVTEFAEGVDMVLDVEVSVLFGGCSSLWFRNIIASEIVFLSCDARSSLNLSANFCCVAVSGHVIFTPSNSLS